jgi:hypothetical protein
MTPNTNTPHVDDSEIVERVARAIWESCIKSQLTPAAWAGVNWVVLAARAVRGDSWAAGYRKVVFDEARAITTLREAGWKAPEEAANEALESAARHAIALTKKWGNPNGTAEQQAIWDHGIARCAPAIRALASKADAGTSLISTLTTLAETPTQIPDADLESLITTLPAALTKLTNEYRRRRHDSANQAGVAGCFNRETSQ